MPTIFEAALGLPKDLLKTKEGGITPNLDRLHRVLCTPELPTNPPELSEAKQAFQEEIEELERAKGMLLDAQEIFDAYGHKDMAEDLMGVLVKVQEEIRELEDKVNDVEGGGE